MIHRIVFALAMLCAGAAWGQGSQWPADRVVFDDAETLQAKLDAGVLGNPTRTVVSALPSPPNPTTLTYIIIDGQDASDCTVGGASPGTLVHCAWDGAAWAALGGGGGGTVDGLTGDSGGTTTGANVTIAGGTNVTTTRASDTVTVTAQPTRIDRDGDGLWEEVDLGDFDGDGSTYETCTAKDTPAPQCKASGEIIYRDFVDDLNYLLVNLADSEVTVNLRHGVVYTGIGCWDAANPTRNDPSDPTTHDNVADASYADCVDDEHGNPMWGVAVRGKKLKLVGGGYDGRDGVTVRTLGTTIAPDNGNYHDAWYSESVQHPYISVGKIFNPTNTTGISKAGTNAVTATVGRGWGSLTEDESYADALHRRSICVCNDTTAGVCVGGGSESAATGWVQTLSAGDRGVLIIPASVGVGGTAASVGVVAEIGVAGTAASDGGNCTDAQSREIMLGPVLDGTGGTVGPSWGEVDDYDGTGPAYVFFPEDDYWNASLTLENLTIEPQDYRDEAGGDCGDSGQWTFGGGDTDNDCDTNPYIIHYGGKLRMRDVRIKHGMSYTMDGGLVPGDAIIGPGVKWLYGNGEAIVDAGHFWKFEDFEIAHSQFAGNVIATFGSFLTIRKGLFTDIKADQQFITFGNAAADGVITRGNLLEDLRFQGVDIGAVVSLACGSRHNVVRYVRVSGWDGGHTNSGNSLGEGVYKFNCTNASNPITQNAFSDTLLDAPGIHWRFTGLSNGETGYRQRMIYVSTGSEAGVYGNTFERIEYPAVQSGSLSTVDSSCIYFVEAGAALDAADSDTLTGFLAGNSFISNHIETGRMGCFIDSGGDTNTYAVPELTVNGYGNTEGNQPAAAALTALTDVTEETGAGPFTLTAAEMRGQSYYYSNTGAITITLPAAAAGMSGCFYDLDGTAALSIDVDAADRIVLDGVDLGLGDHIDSPGARGDFICLEALDDTYWITKGRSGTWVDGVP